MTSPGDEHLQTLETTMDVLSDYAHYLSRLYYVVAFISILLSALTVLIATHTGDGMSVLTYQWVESGLTAASTLTISFMHITKLHTVSERFQHLASLVSIYISVLQDGHDGALITRMHSEIKAMYLKMDFLWLKVPRVSFTPRQYNIPVVLHTLERIIAINSAGHVPQQHPLISGTSRLVV